MYFEEVPTAAGQIEDMYASNTSTMAYDDAGNLRYIGADPNNYVSFNGELWRIIGVFSEDTHGISNTKLIKLIRNDSIGNYSWDYSSSGSYGSDWSNSQLQQLLNSGAYYNRTTGSYYNDSTTATTVDFSSTGLTEEAKSMIETVTWKLGGTADYESSNNGLASHWYGYERGTTVFSGNPTEWSGKVGLMYPSDYGYATSGGTTRDRTSCLATQLSIWYFEGCSDCKNNDWLLDSSYPQWTLTPRTSDSHSVFYVLSGGGLNSRTEASTMVPVPLSI